MGFNYLCALYQVDVSFQESAEHEKETLLVLRQCGDVPAATVLVAVCLDKEKRLQGR